MIVEKFILAARAWEENEKLKIQIPFSKFTNTSLPYKMPECFLATQILLEDSDMNNGFELFYQLILPGNGNATAPKHVFIDSPSYAKSKNKTIIRIWDMKGTPISEKGTYIFRLSIEGNILKTFEFVVD